MIRDDVKRECDAENPLLGVEKEAISKMISLSIDTILSEFDFVPSIRTEIRNKVICKVRIKARWIMSDFRIFEEYEIK